MGESSRRPEIDFFDAAGGLLRQYEIDYEGFIWHRPCASNGVRVDNLLEALKWMREHECDRGIK